MITHRRHPLDAVYDIVSSCTHPKSVTELMMLNSVSYGVLYPCLLELVRLGLLDDLKVTENNGREYRWGNLIVPSSYLPNKKPRKSDIPGRKSRDGFRHKYQLNSKGRRFIQLYDEIAEIVKPEKPLSQLTRTLSEV